MTGVVVVVDPLGAVRVSQEPRAEPGPGRSGDVREAAPVVLEQKVFRVVAREVQVELAVAVVAASKKEEKKQEKTSAIAHKTYVYDEEVSNTCSPQAAP